MKRLVFVCNTVYQVMVASWIKAAEFENAEADIIVSDHMNDFETIADRISEQSLFNEVYAIRTKEFVYSYDMSNMDYSIRARFDRGVHPEKQISSIIHLKHKYDAMLIANVDRFSKCLFNVLKNRRYSKVGNSNLKLYLYEDGIASYSKLFENYYHTCIPNNPTWKSKIFDRFICNTKYIFGNVSGMYLFNPDLVTYQPDWRLIQLKKIDKDNSCFKGYLNYIFSYNNTKDIYDRKIIFMEESLYIDDDERPDLKLLNKIADEVGKDNIMVKIHPRNPVNIFEKEGYKTNKDTAIPWELIIMNNDFSDKILITISSASILNPLTIFGIKLKAYSLYNCLSDKPKILEGPLWDCIRLQYDVFPEWIKVCDNLDQIIYELKCSIKNKEGI